MGKKLRICTSEYGGGCDVEGMEFFFPLGLEILIGSMGWALVRVIARFAAIVFNFAGIAYRRVDKILSGCTCEQVVVHVLWRNQRNPQISLLGEYFSLKACNSIA